jgi:hypothetical protein
MVWGCITAKGLGRIVHIEGVMDAMLYTQILNEDIMGTLKALGINKKDIYFNWPRSGLRRRSSMCWIGHQAAWI